MKGAHSCALTLHDILTFTAAILQRVLSGSVTVEKELVSSIGRGVLVFAAVAPGDTEKEMESMANKVLRMKLWDDDSGGRALSQFTLLAKTTKGTKPDFHGAANPEEARRLYQYFLQKVQAGYQADRVKDGRFQAMMEVALVNDGPVTLELNVGGKATQDNDRSDYAA
ncbi:deacylase [Beauveria brongniartii RCEF 3172]|uniref:D-aminoacyl-tRNA deacylase n=1 Tax=Beauveria brongniartii RCEF 3172 TaxID=1081107 RepID=A0A167K2T1_9HYPO|nr:deacylase [Beauveria brongniartii RCEF 3172]